MYICDVEGRHTSTISATFLKEPSILALVRVDEHAGQFFSCVHSDRPLVRLLVPLQYGKADSAMGKTDIFMQLKKFKDVEWYKKLAEAKIGKPRYTRTNHLLKLLGFPSTVEVTAPDVGDARGMQLTVVLNKPRMQAATLLSTAVLEYLRSVVSVQLATGVDKKACGRNKVAIDNRVDTRIEYLGWSYDKDKDRAMFSPVDRDGKRMRRTQLHTESLDEAKHFVVTGDRPIKATNVASVGKDDTPAESSDEDGASAAMSEDGAEDEASLPDENIELSSPSIEAREDGGSPSAGV